MQDKKVTIILPTHNESEYFCQSIESCLGQTHKNIELIIIDDFSTDTQIANIIKSFNDRRIRYYRSKKIMGLSYCLNIGLKKSKGDFITWTSGDNYFDYTAIEKMLSHLLKNNEKFVYTSFYCLKNNDIENKSLVRLYDTSSMARNCFECFLMDKEIFDKTCFFDTNTFFIQCYDYLLRISKKFNISFLDEPLCYQRINQNSLSYSDINNFRYGIELIMILYKNAIINKDKAFESLINTGIKYIAKSTKGSFILDFSIKNPFLFKHYIMNNIDKLFAKKRPASKGLRELKQEIEELFVNADKKLAEDNFKELKINACTEIAKIRDILQERKLIKELMKLLLHREMYDLFTEFKILFDVYCKKDHILLCNIAGLEFNYKFKKSEMSQQQILKEASLDKGIFTDAEEDIRKDFFANLTRFKKNRPNDYYLYKLNEEFCVKYLYSDSEDILSLIDFFNNFETKKYIYEKALCLATNDSAIMTVQKRIQELYSSSMNK